MYFPCFNYCTLVCFKGLAFFSVKPVKYARCGVHFNIQLINHEKHGVCNESADSNSKDRALPLGAAAICLPGLSLKQKKLHMQHAKKLQVCWGLGEGGKRM